MNHYSGALVLLFCLLSACEKTRTETFSVPSDKDTTDSSHNDTDSGITTDTGDPGSCSLSMVSSKSTGLPVFSLDWSLKEPGATLTLIATTGFFGADEPGVTITTTWDTDDFGSAGSTENVIALIPTERTDGQSVQEYFRSHGGLEATVNVMASWSNGLACADELRVPFRTWAQIDETECEGSCSQPEDLFLPTAFEADLTEDVADSMADMVVSNTYLHATANLDNFALTLLPLTGTPLQFSRLGSHVFDVWDTEHALHGAVELSCATWLSGRELMFSQAYPNLNPSVSVLLNSNESVAGFGYTQNDETSDAEVWLHHNCFVDPATADKDTITVYTLAWGEAIGESIWSSDLVRVQIDSPMGT